MSADNAYAVELKGLTFKRGARSIFNVFRAARSPASWGLPGVARPHCCV